MILNFQTFLWALNQMDLWNKYNGFEKHFIWLSDCQFCSANSFFENPSMFAIVSIRLHYMAVYPCTCTKGAAASFYLISRLSCSLPRSKPYGGVRVTLWSWSDPCELGPSTASSGPEICCGVQCYAMRGHLHCYFTKPAVLHHIEQSGSGHWIPDNSHCCVCEWTRKSHVREGTHQ